MRDTRRSSKPEYRARYPDARPFLVGTTRCGVRSAQRADLTSIYATRNPGAGQDITCLAAAVQLRLRVAVGLQALQRCSGLLNRRARGSTVATHHFGGGTRIEKFMRSLACPARRIKLLPSASSSVSNAPVAQCIERRASNAEVAGESPAGSANFIYDLRFTIDDFCSVSPTTRDAPLRTERLGVEIPHAAPICPCSPTQRRRT